MKKEKKITILVIEDEVPLQRAISNKLSKHGYEVVTARKTEQGINFLKDIPDVKFIWLDHYLLGKKSGLDFVAEIKKNKKWKKIPIIVVSNTVSERKVSSYIALGVNKYYVKAECRLDTIIKDIEKIIK